MRCSKRWRGCNKNMMMRVIGGCCKKDKGGFIYLKSTPIPHLQPWLLNDKRQLKDYNPITSLQDLSWDFSCNFFTYFLVFVQDIIGLIQDVMSQVQDFRAPSQ